MARPCIKIGGYQLSNIQVPMGDNHVMTDCLWIESDSGEGMSVPYDHFVNLIDELWSDF